MGDKLSFQMMRILYVEFNPVRAGLVEDTGNTSIVATNFIPLEKQMV